MGTMMFEVPDDRPVHIFIGDGALAIAGEPPRISTEKLALPRRRRPLLIVSGSIAVLAVGFVLGQHTIASHADAEVQTANIANPAPPPVEQAFPDHALGAPNSASPGAPAATRVPPALTQQLAQPPQVVPPPGQPRDAAQQQKNAFGLGD